MSEDKLTALMNALEEFRELNLRLSSCVADHGAEAGHYCADLHSDLQCAHKELDTMLKAFIRDEVHATIASLSSGRRV